MALPPPADTYLTLAGPATAEHRDRGSKFLGFAYPVDTEHDIRAALDHLRAQHPKANHHCYAWRLGTDHTLYRANDDGEPSGTAGRPILGRIDAHQLTHVLVVVVRYFGGTLLGTSGLINAYRTTAAQALEAGSFEQRVVEQALHIEFDYEAMPRVQYLVKHRQWRVTAQDFGTQCRMSISVARSQAPEALQALLELRGVQARAE